MFAARTMIPDKALVICLVELELLIEGAEVALMKGVPIAAAPKSSVASGAVLRTICWAPGVDVSVMNTLASLASESMTRTGRVPFWATLDTIRLVHVPATSALPVRARTSMRGATPVTLLVLTAAMTRPVLSVFRLMCPSALSVPLPPNAVSRVPHDPSAAVSR